MKKVLATGTKYIFGVFCLAVLGLLMTLTYQGLGEVFPGQFDNQIWGLVLFDIATMCWALAFVFASHTTTQYATSAIGFLVGFIGTLGIVAAEVALNASTTDPELGTEISKWMVYTFIGVTALHAALIYMHHAGAPDIQEKIDVGIARGEITTAAISRATHELDVEKAELAHSIALEIKSRVKRDLGLVEATGTIFQPQVSSLNLTPYALPCGHTEGAHWNPSRNTWACNVCYAAIEDINTSANVPHPTHTADKDKATQPKTPFLPE